MYSTASSTDDHPKFRIVFNTDTPIVATKLRHFWYALNQELNEIGDAQTKDLARMYYIPADYDGASNFFYRNSGEPIDLAVLLDKWPYDDSRNAQSFLDRLPPAFIEKGYPITATQIVELCRQFDIETGKWYENRPMEVEANNALEYAYKNGTV